MAKHKVLCPPFSAVEDGHARQAQSLSYGMQYVAVALDPGQHFKIGFRTPSRHRFRMAQSAMQQLGNNVRAARKRAGLSQSAFAEKCEMDRLYLGRIELGKQNPTVAIVMRIALEAGTEAATLLKGIIVDPEDVRALPRPNRSLRPETD